MALVEDAIPQPRRTIQRIVRHWRQRGLLFKNHGRVQGFLILLARFQRPGSRRAALLFGAADWYWWHFHFKKRWGSGY